MLVSDHPGGKDGNMQANMVLKQWLNPDTSTEKERDSGSGMGF